MASEKKSKLLRDFFSFIKEKKYHKMSHIEIKKEFDDEEKKILDFFLQIGKIVLNNIYNYEENDINDEEATLVGYYLLSI